MFLKLYLKTLLKILFILKCIDKKCLTEEASYFFFFYILLQMNFILFICIIRILRQKINCPDIGRSESNQYS